MIKRKHTWSGVQSRFARQDCKGQHAKINGTALQLTHNSFINGLFVFWLVDTLACVTVILFIRKMGYDWFYYDYIFVSTTFFWHVSTCSSGIIVRCGYLHFCMTNLQEKKRNTSTELWRSRDYAYRALWCCMPEVNGAFVCLPMKKFGFVCMFGGDGGRGSSRYI